MRDNVCLNCHKAYVREPGKKNVKYCSQRCARQKENRERYQAKQKAKKDENEKVCLNCGRPTSGEYCSIICARQREKRELQNLFIDLMGGNREKPTEEKPMKSGDGFIENW